MSGEETKNGTNWWGELLINEDVVETKRPVESPEPVMTSSAHGLRVIDE